VPDGQHRARAAQQNEQQGEGFLAHRRSFRRLQRSPGHRSANENSNEPTAVMEDPDPNDGIH
jgi:hypothetical protein